MGFFFSEMVVMGHFGGVSNAGVLVMLSEGVIRPRERVAEQICDLTINMAFW